MTKCALPSYADEADFFGDGNAAETAERYLQNGAELTVVKDGPEPVVVRQAEGRIFQFQPPVSADIVDTTAAGDSFNAAFLVEYLKNSTLQAAVEAGCALSGHVISQRGALVPVKEVESSNEIAAVQG